MFYNFFRRLLKIISRPHFYARFVGVKIGVNCKLMTKEFGTEPYLVEIGDNVEVTSGVKFINHEGALWCIRQLYAEFSSADIIKPIKIGSNVYIGNDAKIMPGVQVMDDTIIGANSLLLNGKKYGPGVFAGSPARFICTLDEFVEKKKVDFENTKSLEPNVKKAFYINKYHN